MQHAIIDAMKCMRAIKGRIARPVNQLANHLSRASIPCTVYQPGKSSVRDLQSPSSHHSSVVFRHNQSVGHHSDDSVGLFRHDRSVGQSQRGSKSAMFTLKAVKSAQFVPPTADFYLNRYNKARKFQPAPTSFSFYSLNWVTTGRATHKESSATKIAQNHDRERQQSTEKELRHQRLLTTEISSSSQRNQQQPSDVVFSKEHQNDAASTNQNDAAALQQLTTDTFQNNQQLVTLNNSKTS
ncbi:hypothetical protein F511_11822 [Dorcoceras hygrometricum]|uniref:Uncharacterized protein n=1 Tax=Dorcoceras hygrometricum TaxID=472368 RepID=A0A2Z7D603_9LAMI|nr:hypothetical protein F511_11822 [Dorcoceras hygrometricum]